MMPLGGCKDSFFPLLTELSLLPKGCVFVVYTRFIQDFLFFRGVRASPETLKWSIMVDFGETTSVKELFLGIAAEFGLK